MSLCGHVLYEFRFHCTAWLPNDVENTSRASGTSRFWVQTTAESLMSCVTFASYLTSLSLSRDLPEFKLQLCHVSCVTLGKVI